MQFLWRDRIEWRCQAEICLFVLTRSHACDAVHGSFDDNRVFKTKKKPKKHFCDDEIRKKLNETDKRIISKIEYEWKRTKQNTWKTWKNFLLHFGPPSPLASNWFLSHLLFFVWNWLILVLSVWLLIFYDFCHLISLFFLPLLRFSLSRATRNDKWNRFVCGSYKTWQLNGIQASELQPQLIDEPSALALRNRIFPWINCWSFRMTEMRHLVWSDSEVEEINVIFRRCSRNGLSGGSLVWTVCIPQCEPLRGALSHANDLKRSTSVWRY